MYFLRTHLLLLDISTKCTQHPGLRLVRPDKIGFSIPVNSLLPTQECPHVQLGVIVITFLAGEICDTRMKMAMGSGGIVLALVLACLSRAQAFVAPAVTGGLLHEYE